MDQNAAPTTVAQKRQIWLMIAGAFTVQPVLLYVFVGQQASARTVATEGFQFDAVAVVALGIAVVMAVQVLRPKAELGEKPVLMEPALWQVRSLIAMAFAELAALLGVFLIGGARMLPYVAATIAVMVMAILPAGWAYFAALQDQESAPED